MEQIRRLNDVIDRLRSRAIQFPIIHTANSAAILDVPESYFNKVRLGIALYGYYPSDETSRSLELHPAMSMHSRILHLKNLPPGSPVSYGRTFVTARDTLVATLPVGYADGLSTALSNRGKMIVKAADGTGVVCPVIGRVCMDLTLLDVTDVPGVGIGSEVVVYSPRREDPNSVESTAEAADTIPYVVTCAVSKRVPRVYLPAHPPNTTKPQK